MEAIPDPFLPKPSTDLRQKLPSQLAGSGIFRFSPAAA